jgi:hypothetical protein
MKTKTEHTPTPPVETNVLVWREGMQPMVAGIDKKGEFIWASCWVGFYTLVSHLKIRRHHKGD